MRRSQSFKSVVAALAVAVVTAHGPGANNAAAQAVGIEVPFGDKVGPALTNYNRLRPKIATAGLLKDGAISQIKLLGFTAILDLRTSEEGTDVEKKAVEAAGLRYFNIPVKDVPSDAQVEEFARIVEDVAHFPILIHCGSAGRVGAMWTLYRARNGIQISIAVDEGRTIGMKRDREDAVLKRLGHPALDQ
jgi:uncharacterized protein (TIGR01244 family)